MPRLYFATVDVRNRDHGRVRIDPSGNRFWQLQIDRLDTADIPMPVALSIATLGPAAAHAAEWAQRFVDRCRMPAAVRREMQEFLRPVRTSLETLRAAGRRRCPPKPTIVRVPPEGATIGRIAIAAGRDRDLSNLTIVRG